MDNQLKRFFRQFVPFTDAELTEARGFFKVKTFTKNSFFVKEGDIVNEILFIKKGSFRIFYVVNGKEITQFVGLENIFITSMPAFITHQPSIEYIQALEDSTALALTYEDSQKMYALSPKWERTGRIMAEHSFVDLQNRIYSLISESAQIRITRLKKERPFLLKRVPQYILADFLGISPETLSRLSKIPDTNPDQP